MDTKIRIVIAPETGWEPQRVREVWGLAQKSGGWE